MSSQSQRDLTDDFDAFYKHARDRLLLQTYALTGDLGAARSAVRDAFVVAWHHWRKLSRLDDPETSVRPQAWRNALRRATVRPWHKEKNLADDDRRTLEALAGLTVQQRRALLLTQLAAVSMDDVAREIGLPVETAERELQTAVAQFSMQRDVPAASIPLVFSDLAGAAGRVTWPRVTIIRRAGAARRRMHTALGAAVVVAALVGSGVAVSDATGVRPTLDREALPSPAAGTGAVTAGPEVNLPQSSLLEETSLGDLSGDWVQGPTHDNSAGTGMVLPCQPERERYADPDGEAAWVRVFRNGPPKKATRDIVQLAEASKDERRSKRAYLRLRDWVADCQTAGLRLVSTEASPTVGDASAVITLHDQEPETATYVVGLARTGLFTTSVALRTDVGPGLADRAGVARLLGDAVTRLCALPGGGRCADAPARLEPLPAYPAGEVTAMLSPVDLPFVGRPDEPWMGTPPRQITSASTDIDVLGCQNPSLAERYDGTRFRTDLVRTFLKVGRTLPPEFGFTQAVASLPRKKAAALVDDYRASIDDCPESDASAGTEVRVVRAYDEGDRSFTAWHLSTQLPGERTVEYDVAVVRDGEAISQLVFISAEGARMTDDQFVELTERALDRLSYLPPYDR